MRLEIVGGIASGKSTLAAVLARQGVEPVYESFAANPFFELFYSNPTRYAFQTEVTYMLQHYSSIADATDAAHKRVVADFSMALDLAYARVTLSPDDLKIFEQVYDHAVAKIGWPDLLIKLDCAPEIELARIRARARPAEKSIELDYLRRLNLATEAVLDDARFRGQAVLRINSGALDFRPEGRDRADVVNQVLSRLSPL